MNKQDIKIPCADGFELIGTLYEPTVSKAAIMIAPATGIKRQFYNSFATHLAENGYGVICFDNRGIGGSTDGSINDVDASLINWGRLDMPAVLKKLQATFPNQSHHLIGHSAGGQLLGLMDNSPEINSMFNFACSSGSLRNMPYPFKFTAAFYLNVFLPVSNLLFGKTNSQWMGMGEPIPKRVAVEWNRWCNGAGYVATDFGKEIKEHHYHKLELPSMWLYATDDGIANLANVNDMTRVYTKSKIEILALDPKELGLKQLGHMGFFSSKNKKVWKHAIEWLQSHE